MDIVSKNVSARGAGRKASMLPSLSLTVKKERVKLGLSQNELAKIVGIGLKTLRKIEQGNLNVNFIKLNYLLNCLGLYLRPSELVVSPVNRSKDAMSKESVLHLLRKIYPILRIRYDVCELALFGSYAKEQEDRDVDSDIDILIDFKDVVDFEVEGEIQLILENLFGGVKVDLTLKSYLYPMFEKEIERTKINVSEEV